MNNRQLALIMIAIIAGCCIIAGAIILSNTGAEQTNATIANNTTNDTENMTVKEDATESKDVGSSGDGYDYVSDENGYEYKVKDGKIYNPDGSGGQYFTENDRKVMNGEIEDPRASGG